MDVLKSSCFHKQRAVIFLAVATLFLIGRPAYTLERATVQLKWLHHFQFAGYYAALEKGFYREAGLDVTISEGGPTAEVENDVATGKADFGVGTSALLLNLAKGQDLVVLGQVFQHSPAIFLTPRKTGIRSVGDMHGRRFMYSNQHGDMLALLKKYGIDEDNIIKVSHQGNPRDLIDGKADVMLAYSFNEPFAMERAGEPYFAFSPLSSGIDFYGDNFFTSRKLINSRPNFAEAFRKATLQGWSYALNHKAEIADLILAKYSKEKSREWLLFEANQLENLIQPTLVELGYQSQSRWQNISATFSDLGMIPKGFNPTPIIYAPQTINYYRSLITSILISVVIMSVLGWLVFNFRRLNRNLTEEINKRKLMENVLRESEEKYRILIENANDIVYSLSLDGVFTYVSPIWTKLLGHDISEVENHPFESFVHPEDLPGCLAFMEKAIKSGEKQSGVEYRVLRKNGDWRWHTTNASPIWDATGTVIAFMGIARDITERKNADEMLRKSEARFRSILQDVQSVAVQGYAPDGTTQYWNRASERLYGYSAQEAIGKSLLDLVIPPDIRDEVERAMKQMAETGIAIPASELSLLRKDGSRVAVFSSHTIIQVPGRQQELFCIDIDLTERMIAEEQKRSLEERLQRAEKMEALGQLAGGVAHDLNNVLGILTGYSELLMEESPEGSRSRNYVDKILQSTEKGATIIQDLLTLARRGVTATDVINLNHIISGFFATPVFEKLKDHHPRVTFRTEYDKNLLNIKGSPVHLEKTLMNLVSNAAEAISEAGGVIIRTENRYLDMPISGYDDVKEGDYVVLTISDTGSGISAVDRDKIFEPFFTKKVMGRSGTGLGLAIVWGTVKDHLGYIDVRTEIGQGTTFTLYFPVTREDQVAPQQKLPIEQYMGNGESVLVVDDVVEQQEIASRLLARLGYKVTLVSSGEEAVEYLKENKADILVLDMIMPPGIDGLETYKRVLKINRHQKAILVSGFSETDRVKEAYRLGAGAYVRKPYVMEKIGVAIRNELARK